MARKTGLGRGLAALIPGNEQPVPGGISSIPVDRIKPNPMQPRAREKLENLPADILELAESIKEHGILQPLIVTYDPAEDVYILIAGERRWRAAQQAGLDSVPALIREATEQERLELALIENIQRADLDPLEEAEAYRQLTENFSLTHDEVARRVGKSRETITNILRLLNLAPDVREALLKGKITESHARTLLGLTNPEAQSAALNQVLERNLTVRQTEELVRLLNGQRLPHPPRPSAAPEITALEDRLRNRLGTRVRLKRRGKGGSLTINFYSEEELNSLVDIILDGDS